MGTNSDLTAFMNRLGDRLGWFQEEGAILRIGRLGRIRRNLDSVDLSTAAARLERDGAQ
jgi:hypothetical protein